MTFVLDCSVTIAWIFEDERTPYSMSVQDALESHEAIVPAVWTYEVANVLSVGERRGRLSSENALLQVSRLMELRISVADCDRALMLRDVRLLSLRTGLAAYDAAYLDLAIRTGAPIATIDARLLAAARAERITIFDPQGLL